MRFTQDGTTVTVTRTATNTYAVSGVGMALLGFVSKTGANGRWQYAYRVDGQTFRHDGFATRAMAVTALRLARTA